MTGLRVSIPGVLGDTLQIRVDAHPCAAERVQDVMLAEIARLERVFAPLDCDSEFSRWRRGEGVELQPSTDLAKVLAASERLWVFSKGAFHPAASPLVRRWRLAEAEGVLPTRAEMKLLATSLQLPYTSVHGPIVRTGDCSQVDLSSIARGYVIDAALEAGWRLGLASSISVDAGGERRHRGSGAIEIALPDALGCGDVRPIETLLIADAAFAHSSRPSRGFFVDGIRHSDMIDPSTGWPNDDVVSVFALAADAMTADVLATVVGVGRTMNSSVLPGAWLVQYADGEVHRSPNWPIVGRTTRG